MPRSRGRQGRTGSGSIAPQRSLGAPQSSGWRGWILAGIAIGATTAAFVWLRPAPSATIVDVRVPVFSARAERGLTAFEAQCALCHGINAAGSESGPPLVHRIYEPGHHADGAFQFAVRYGVRAHHWRFGNMPPQPEVSDGEIADIVTYVRELQHANGVR
jgi:mono/diheme cytochrome c family protein